MNRLLGSLVALVALCGATFAQINVVPQVGVTTAYLPKVTYSAVFIGLVPAASATDVVCIAGSATKTVRVQSVKLSGTAGTLVTLPVTLLRRASVDTAGTAAGTTANPANTISRRDSGFTVAPTATLISYTANPTINDASPTYIDSANVTLPVTTAGTVIVPLEFNFGRDVENFLQSPALIGAAQQLCLNLNAISVTTGLLTGSIHWTEE